jgi:RNA polymerase sigma factor (sigma-70 family)
VNDLQPIDDQLRILAPQVLATMIRRHRQFDVCEDAVQESLIAAATQWPAAGVPDNPRGWLLTVAERRFVDAVRRDQARQRREDAHARSPAPEGDDATDASGEAPERDDSLTLLVMCCHPALTAASQIALTLRALGGLTTAEIASAFFVPEATMAQRISRAKATVAAVGATFDLPSADELPARLAAAMHVLYLIFNEGHTTSAGASLSRPDLSAEAIRLVRILVASRPDDHEARGLLALMLLTDARRAARTGPDGSPVNLADQNRDLWDRASIAEGVTLVTSALATGAPGPYQLQAAIAAIHDEAPSDAETDWPQIVGLYDLLLAIAPNPMAALSRAIAWSRVHGPEAGLAALADLETDPRLAHSHRLHAARGQLLRELGEDDQARDAYVTAARLATNEPERRHLLTQSGRG